jgi:amino acid adenylation domain-containing protein
MTNLIHRAFLNVARTRPQILAVSAPSGQLTYGELELQSRRITSGLIRRGAKRGDVVAILAERESEVIASMLACARSGFVFTVMDLAYPPARIAQLLDIARPALVIACGNISETGVMWRGPFVIAEQCQILESFPSTDIAGNDAAYLLFTSGSTGFPKCISCCHYPLLNFIQWDVREFGLSANDRFTMLSGLSHDPFLRDVFVPLSIGASIHIPKQAEILGLGSLFSWMHSVKPTVAHMTPPLGHLLASAPRPKPIDSLRYIFWGGDALRSSLLSTLKPICGSCAHVNFYGSTETPQAASYFRVSDTAEGAPISVGKGIDGFSLLVLDEEKKALAAEEVGEIVVRSRFLTMGYVENGVLPSPKTAAPEDDYATGDMGYALPDGSIVLVGRRDDQVKIRGYRVELGEISACALQHPAISDAVTLNIGDKDTVKIGLFVKAQGVDAETVSAHIKSKLPLYMAPPLVQFVDAMPLLPNGKVDRLALIEAASVNSPSENKLDMEVAGLDDRMRTLIAGIEDALDTLVTSLDKSFIDLGGDSLSYIRVSMLIEETLGWLPQDWEKKPLSEFSRLSAAPEKARKASKWVSVDVTMVFRAISIVFVTMNHTNAFSYIAATSTLFVISGMNFQKFLRPAIKVGAITPTIKFILKFGIPAGLWQVLRSFMMHSFWLPDLLLLGTFFQKPGSTHFTLWFLDVLAANLILLSLIGKISYHLLEKSEQMMRDTFWTDLLWLLLGIGLAFAQVASGWGDGEVGKTGVAPFKWFWLLAFGVLIAQADSARRKWFLTGLLVGLALGAYSGLPGTEILNGGAEFFFASLLIMLWIERAPVPRWLQRPLLVVASSTLFIYIVNYTVIVHVMPRVGLPNWWPLEVLTAVLAGIIAKAVWDQAVARASSLFLYLRRRRHGYV